MNFKPKPSNNNAALLVLAVICDLQSEISSEAVGKNGEISSKTGQKVVG